MSMLGKRTAGGKRRGMTTAYSSGGALVKRFKKQRAPAQSRVQAAVVAAVRRAGEKKGVDTILTLSPVIATTNTNASSFVINLIQPGSGSWNRIGRKVNLQSARFRFSINHTYTLTAVTSDTAGNQLRMVVVWDKQPSGGAIPTFDTIFGRTDQGGTEVTTFLDPVKYDNMDRFSVLRDCVISPKVNATPPVGGTTNFISNFYEVDEFVKLGGRETVYSGQSVPQTIADISTGALYVFFRAQVNSGTNLMGISDDAFCRLRYNDP